MRAISIRRSLWRRLMPFFSLVAIWAILFLNGSASVRAQAPSQSVPLGVPEMPQVPQAVPQAVPQEILEIPQKVLQEVRGVWMTVNDSEVWMNRDRMHRAVDELARSNFNTIYPVVWNSGYVMYPSPFAQKEGIQTFIPLGKQKQDTLAELIAYAHQRGLRVVPWMEFGFMTPPTSELAMLHPNWLTQKKDGTQTDDESVGEVVWLNPFRPEVQQFFSGLVTEVASSYDVDGIQFDDHTSLPSKFGYDPYTLDLYAKETEKAKEAQKARAVEKAKNVQEAKKQVKKEATELKETKEVETPMSTDPKVSEWIEWRANKLTDYIVQLHQTVKAIRPKAVFSVAPNPYDTAYLGSLQDWLAWFRKGIVDELIVQVYRTDFNSFITQVNRPELQEAKKKISTGIGVLAGLRNRQIPMSQIQAQTKYVRSQGLGATFFYFECLWNYAPESIQQRQVQFQELLLPSSVKADNP
ncbi:MAG: family 10 glycosylhydrolase [Thermosynechococcaceae cyanobacterium]